MQTENEKAATANEEVGYEDEIHLTHYWNIIWRWRTLIGLIACVGVVATTVYALSLADIYRVGVILMPIGENKGNTGGLSAFVQQVGGLPGLPLPGSRSAAEIVQLLNSKILRKRLMERYKLLPILFSEQWDAKKKDWKEKDDVPTIWDGLRELDGMIGVENNSEKNTITVTVDHHDPEIAANIAHFLLTALNDHMSSESKKVAETNRKYLEDQLQHTSDPLIRQKIYHLIAQQIETSMMAGVKENFAFKVIDPPMVPDRKIEPQRRQMVMLSFVVSLIAGLILAFFLEYIATLKTGKSQT